MSAEQNDTITNHDRTTLSELANKYVGPNNQFEESNISSKWRNKRETQISDALRIVELYPLRKLENINSKMMKKKDLSWGQKIIAEAVLRCILSRREKDVNEKIASIASKSILEILTIHSEIKNKNHFEMLNSTTGRKKLSWEEESTAIAVKQIMEPIQSLIDPILSGALLSISQTPSF